MLRTFLKFWGQWNSASDHCGDESAMKRDAEVVLFADLRQSGRRRSSKKLAKVAADTNPMVAADPMGQSVPAGPLTSDASRPTPSHRARVLGMNLKHTKLCTDRRCDRLASVGVITAGDLMTAEPLAIAKKMGAPAKAEATLRRYQQAIRLSAAVPGLMPRDASLLVSIHRKSIRALAIDSPAMLHRDLERFALSSRGQREMKGRRLPSLRRVRRWIEASSSLQVAV
ncbi:DUF4332 domain-containing protein [Crateriforma conspicua]|uniref:DUF4332 domain-containing protein n=1 Tax=Crateriforma conspicua TaxID=2527996 RepID=A0A5C5XZC4_9PLAN|nr:DUF4332 domain-containing protein [Crateriforma conspicua]QDV63163.1 hypothetical protein Mal65_23050 [Crateriforma conspicua]TWT68068.1 hypothetical protein Pan14r_03060 [Crateriforma conspicua]